MKNVQKYHFLKDDTEHLLSYIKWVSLLFSGAPQNNYQVAEVVAGSSLSSTYKEVTFQEEKEHGQVSGLV